jgi:hypothetical protein
VDVHNDLMPGVEQRLRGRPSQTACGARDEDAHHHTLSGSSPLIRGIT